MNLSEFTDCILRKLESWDISNVRLSHPYLLFTRDEIPDIRRKARLIVGDLNGIERHAEKTINELRRVIRELKASVIAKMALEHAFMYILTGNKSLADNTQELVLSVLDIEDWVLEAHKPLKVDLGVANTASALGLIYDWLYEHMDDSLRKEIRNSLLNRALEPFRYISARKLEWWTMATHNWRSAICGGIGTASLSLLNEYDNFKQCLKEAIVGVITVFNRIGEDGSYDEGLGYWGYGIGMGVKFAEALKRTTKGLINLFKHPRLKRTGYFALYLYTPDGKCFNFSDCRYRPPLNWLVAKLASEYRDPYLQWLAWKIRSYNALYVIFYDDTLKPKVPDIPPYKVFKEIGVAVTRSGWEDESSYLGFKTGKTNAPHAHLDVNSFVFYAYGKRLIKDLGSWPYTLPNLGFFDKRERRWCYEANSTLGHNTLLVDGMGQRCGDDNYGKIVKSKFSDEVDLLIGDGASAYDNLLTKYNRWLIFIKPTTLVIIDDVASDVPRRFEIIFHPDGNLREDKESFTVINDDVYLKVIPVKPSSDEPRIMYVRRSITSYESRGGPTVRENLYFSISPLFKFKEYIFVTVMHANKGKEPKVKATIEQLTAERVSLKVCTANSEFHIDAYLRDFNLAFHKHELSNQV